MHDPGAFLSAAREMKHALALAGHTHGGQVSLPLLGAMIIPGRSPRHWARGWVELASGPLYVSAGVGTSILPVRFGAPPEFLVLGLGAE